ncbi:MAG: cupin domain-containing protein [Proteobacteria bacterium]|nr:cupin domain-containing protein [Pseudomonadota bacterium]
MSSTAYVIDPHNIEPDTRSTYPTHLQEPVRGRRKRRLGLQAGLRKLSVVHVELPPGAASSLKVWQSHEDEYVLVLAGEATLVTDASEEILKPGQSAGFPAGQAIGHQIVNRGITPLVFIEVGTIADENVSTYPDDDLLQVPDGRGRRFVRHDGTPFGA